MAGVWPQAVDPPLRVEDVRAATAYAAELAREWFVHGRGVLRRVARAGQQGVGGRHHE